MADAVRGPVVGRPSAFANEELMAIHSWSRVSSAGHSVLLDALKILSPMSRELSTSEDIEDLVTFLQELNAEGHKPTVLRSKDVYRYRSVTVQPLTQDRLKPPSRSTKPAAGKRKGKKVVPKKVHPSWSNQEQKKPRIQGVRPPDPHLMNPRTAVVCSSRTPPPPRPPPSSSTRTVDVSVGAVGAVGQPALQLRPCLRLTNIAGQTGFHTARLKIQTTWDPLSSSSSSSSEAPPPSSVAFPQQQQKQQKHPALLSLSGIPSQPSQNGVAMGTPTKAAVALFSQKNLSCPIRLDGALIGDSAPVFYTNGRAAAFPETHTELTSNGWTSNNGFHRDTRGQHPKDLSSHSRQRNGFKDKNGLRWKVVKVDDSRSVAEARRKAQKMLQVNLSPVIKIQPLNHVLRDFRYQNK